MMSTSDPVDILPRNSENPPRVATDPVERVDVLRAISRVHGLRFENCVGVAAPRSFTFAEVSLDPDEFIKPGGARHHLLSFHLAGGRAHRLDRQGRQGCVGRAGLTTVLPAEASSRWKTDAPIRALNFAVSHASLVALAVEAFDYDHGNLEVRDEYFVPDLAVSNLVHMIRQQLLLAHHPIATEIDAWGNLIGMHLIRTYSNLPCKAVEPSVERLSATQRRRAIDFMQDHLDRNVSLHDIAKALGMTQFRFARAFRNATGVSVHQSLVDMRISRARELLSQTEHPLAEVAYACGFASQSHMTSWFRRKHGLTPRQFRQSVEI
jgi:AraC family transcriptional regulator